MGVLAASLSSNFLFRCGLLRGGSKFFSKLAILGFSILGVGSWAGGWGVLSKKCVWWLVVQFSSLGLCGLGILAGGAVGNVVKGFSCWLLAGRPAWH